MKRTQWNILLPDDWKKAITREAKKAGISKADYIRNAIKKHLPSDTRKELSPVKVGRPSGGDK